MIDTQDKLAELLTENTGSHFLDSGGHYGRHWERNQGRDFAAEPEGNLEFCNHNGVLEIGPTLSVYHFLKTRLEFNPDLDRRYRAYVEQEDEDLGISSAESFAESIDGQGVYGDGSPMTVNTGEDLLSQTLQYVYWTDDDGAHVLLQIHGGCDIRGGYTDPVAFDVDGDTSIFDNARASIYCDGCEKRWDLDGSYWAPDGCYGKGFTQLQDYPATDERPEYPEPPDPSQRTLFDVPDRSDPCADVVWVDGHNGHCPYCGGLLHVASS